MPGRGNPWREGGLRDSTVTSPDIKNFSIWGVDLSFFKSTVLTGTGAPLPTPHGLGRTPALVIVTPYEIAPGDLIVEGSHDATSVIVTAPVTTKYVVIAL